MSHSRFDEVASRIRVEQLLAEKRASARGVTAVDKASLYSAAQLSDPVLFKLAFFYDQDNAMDMYKRMGGTVKVAEPPPPKGVSLKQWDRILNENPPTKK